MTYLQAILLGIIQGITEFFPVSSSAHLKFFRLLLGLPEGETWLYFDLTCHAGTWISLCWFLRKDIWNVLRSPRQIALFSLALAPLVPAYFLLKPVRLALSTPQFTPYFLLMTAVLLFAATKKRAPVFAGEMMSSHESKSTNKFSSVLSIGMMQSLALLPGLSRSGSTIAAGRFCGLSWVEAARFSFLLAVPTILGGEMIESIKLLRGTSDAFAAIPTGCYVAAFATSCLVGLGSVRLVFWFYEKNLVKPFIYYCIAFALLLMGLNG